MNLLKESAQDCKSFRDWLEEPAFVGEQPDQLEVTTLAQHEHTERCERCREAFEQTMAARELLKEIPMSSPLAGRGFAGRVMVAIRSRETELKEAANTWLAVPKLASRLAWASAALLLLASSWIYEKPRTELAKQTNAEAAPEYLFEPVASASHDEILASLAEPGK